MDASDGPASAAPSFTMPNPPTKQEMSTFKQRLLRTKTIAAPSFDTPGGDEAGGGGLLRVLRTFDLVSLGVGSCVGTGMYVVSGLVVKNVAGPAAIFSFVIAAFASILSGVCYGEFGVRVPKTSGSAYMYSYVTVGEFVAFLIGWNMILEYLIGSAASASALSAAFDALVNHSMSRSLELHVGTVIGKTYPDFLGCAIAVAMTAVLAKGVRKSVRFNNLLNAVNLLVWLLIVVTSFFYMDGANWNHGFAPHGISGVFSGAATCFYAFIGFDIIATTGTEAKDPARSIPRAIIMSLVICLVGYVSITLVLSLLVPMDEIHGDSAVIDMFVQAGAPGFKFVVAIGAMAALTVSLFGSMFPMPRIIYAMSRDGLLFNFLSQVSPSTGTPLVATLLSGLLSALLSLLVGLQILVEMMSIGTLLAYTLVSASVLILRYQPSLHELPVPMAHRLELPESTEASDASEFGSSGNLFAERGGGKVNLKDKEGLISGGAEQKKYGSLPFVGERARESLAFLGRHGTMLWLRLGLPGDEALPNKKSARTAIIFTGLLATGESATCLLIVYGAGPLSRGSAWSVLVLLVMLVAVGACFYVLLRQPQNKQKLAFMAPCVPLLPAVAMFANIYLMLKLPPLTWARLGVWVFLGLLLYFSYSMSHSAKERKKAEELQQEQVCTDLGEQSAYSSEQNIFQAHQQQIFQATPEQPFPTETYQQQPAPTYQQQPAPTYQQQPAPTYQQQPAPTYQQQPAQTYQQQPAPAYQNQSAPTSHQKPAPTYQQQPRDQSIFQRPVDEAEAQGPLPTTMAAGAATTGGQGKSGGTGRGSGRGRGGVGGGGAAWLSQMHRQYGSQDVSDDGDPWARDEQGASRRRISFQ